MKINKDGPIYTYRYFIIAVVAVTVVGIIVLSLTGKSESNNYEDTAGIMSDLQSSDNSDTSSSEALQGSANSNAESQSLSVDDIVGETTGTELTVLPENLALTEDGTVSFYEGYNADLSVTPIERSVSTGITLSNTVEDTMTDLSGTAVDYGYSAIDLAASENLGTISLISLTTGPEKVIVFTGYEQVPIGMFSPSGFTPEELEAIYQGSEEVYLYTINGVPSYTVTPLNRYE